MKLQTGIYVKFIAGINEDGTLEYNEGKIYMIKDETVYLFDIEYNQYEIPSEGIIEEVM